MQSGDAKITWPFRKHVLIVDGEPVVRETMARALACAGCVARQADSWDTALSLAMADHEVGFVLLGHDTRGWDLRGFLLALLSARPSIVIVGMGDGNAAEFAAAGVHRFLQESWTVEALIALLPDRIGPCVDCGLPLPLRRARNSERSQSWMCASCGGRYSGVLDEEFPAEHRRNARAID